MIIARLSLLHSLPRLASMAPFLCLIVAQCEWPDMASPSRWSASGLQEPQFLLDLVGPTLAAARVGLVQRQRFFPGRGRLVLAPQAVQHVAEVVPDGRVVPPRQVGGPLQLTAGRLPLAAAEQHPPEAVHVGGVVLVGVYPRGGAGLPLLAVEVQRLADEP